MKTKEYYLKEFPNSDLKSVLKKYCDSGVNNFCVYFKMDEKKFADSLFSKEVKRQKTDSYILYFPTLDQIIEEAIKSYNHTFYFVIFIKKNFDQINFSHKSVFERTEFQLLKNECVQCVMTNDLMGDGKLKMIYK
ncbi:hypothetical protein [Aureivirga sp. CE67]|uniref:hypothetical protein n=1 Tax=Aureivirga sp. CE67 TaxID=1788983 RepID=UPI0018C9DDC4|nr:hypothetical protein [Aureivirga sp. CE67]